MLEEPDFSAPPNLDETLQAASSRRAWRWRWIASGATLIVALVLAAQILGPRLATAFSLPTSSAGKTTYELVSNATWATFTIGGRVLRVNTYVILPQITGTTSITITASAPPFGQQQCVISAKATTCAESSSDGIVRIAFRFTFDDLPPDQRAAVADGVTTALAHTQPSTLIAAGAHYALGDLINSPFLATQPLSAALLTSHSASSAIPDRACLELCAPDDIALWTPSTSLIWHTQIYVHQQWRFAHVGNGAVVGTVNEDLLSHPIHFDLIFAPATQQWDAPSDGQGETIADAVTQTLCADGYLNVQGMYFVPSSALANYAPTPTYTDHLLDGCLIQLNTIHGSGHIVFFWHTGILYSADAAAYQAEPSLPRATPQDLATFGTLADQ